MLFPSVIYFTDTKAMNLYIDIAWRENVSCIRSITLTSIFMELFPPPD